MDGSARYGKEGYCEVRWCHEHLPAKSVLKMVLYGKGKGEACYEVPVEYNGL